MIKYLKLLPFVLVVIPVGAISCVLGYIWEAVINGFQSGGDYFQKHAEALLGEIEAMDSRNRHDPLE